MVVRALVAQRIEPERPARPGGAVESRRKRGYPSSVVYVLALGSPNRFRVLTPSDPSRIVVDIQR